MTRIRKSREMRRILYSLILLVDVIPTSGCSDVVDRTWSEEVALDDGRVISIERYVKFRETNSLAGDAYNAIDLKSTLAFQGEFKNLAVWDAPLVPILLYYDVGPRQWVVIATTSNCDTWFEHGSPVPRYWEYRLTGGKWIQTKLSDASIGRKTNLFFIYESSLPTHQISREAKERVIAAHDFPKDYLKIEADAKGCIPRTN